MSDDDEAGDSELVYRYDPPPKLELWRRPLGGGRYLHRIDQQDRLSGVVIVPTDGRSVLLIRQWRESIGRDVWQFPRGFHDDGDVDPIASAARELAEETGLTGLARALGNIWTDPGLLSTSVAVVEIRTDLAAETRSMDPDERILEYRVVEINALAEWILDGRLSDGISLAAWARFTASRGSV